MMKISIAFIAAMLLGNVAHAYQVTGEVLEVTDTKIVVDKSKERFEIARDNDTKGDKNFKKGDRVTVEYSMTASKIESKPSKKDDKGPAKK